jgi:hypothetical protein
MDDLEPDPTDAAEPEEPEEPEETDFDAAEHVLADYETSRDYFADWHEKIAEEVEMVLDNQHHQDNLGHEKNSNYAQVTDMALLSTARRKWSQMAAAPIYINAFPRDGQTDPLSAERTKWALESEVYSTRRMFRRKRKRAIIGAEVGREWWLTFGWNPKLRAITYDTLPPTDAFRCPGYADAHDPECPWLVLRFRLPVSQIRDRARAYGQLDAEAIASIAADTGSQTTSSPTGPLPGMVKLDRSNPEGGPATPREKTAVLLVAMYREDPEAAEIEEALGSSDLAPDDQYMRCWTCGHETTDHPREADGSLPEVGDTCPECMAQDGVESLMAPPLERVSQVESVDVRAKHPNGRWIEVLEEQRLAIYDGDWPYQKPKGGTLPSFPVGQYRVYDDPRHEIPHSDVSWQWNQALMATYLLQWAVDQMRTSGRVLIFPRGALVDGRGRPFVPNNRIDSIAWIKDPMLAKSIQEFQPRGLPSGWSELYGSLVNTFRANLGTGELGLGPDQSKNLPVGTAHAIIESGDIPVDDALANIRDEDGHVLEVIAVMLQCCWTEADWVRFLGPQGQVAYEYFSGADLCDVDVMVTGDPAFDVIQSAKLDRMKAWFDMTPPQQRMAAQLLNLDPTRVAQYQQDQMNWLAQMPPAGGGPGPGRLGMGGPDLHAPPPPPGGAPPLPPMRTDLNAAGLDALSPELQAGLSSMIR